MLRKSILRTLYGKGQSGKWTRWQEPQEAQVPHVLSLLRKHPWWTCFLAHGVNLTSSPGANDLSLKLVSSSEKFSTEPGSSQMLHLIKKKQIQTNSSTITRDCCSLSTPFLRAHTDFLRTVTQWVYLKFFSLK